MSLLQSKLVVCPPSLVAGRLGLLIVFALGSSCSSNNSSQTGQPGVSLPEPADQQAPQITQPGQPTVQAGIPDPASLRQFLPAPRATSYVPADLVKAGADYSAVLPSNKVDKAIPAVDFDPSWNGPPDSTDVLAYCMYAFDIPDYDRNAQVRYTWGTAPLDINDAWIGLANWDDDSWDWYACNETGATNLPAIEPYFSFGGGLLLCVTLMGTDNSSLTTVRIGSEIPLPEFTPTARHGFSPVSVSFNAEASSDPDGTIAKYEWDLDGDRTFETDAGLEPTLEHEFTDTGVFNIGLQVTDNDGLSANTRGTVGVAEPFRHTWGLANTDNAKACVIDAAGNIYLAGSTSSVNATSDLLIAKFNASGQLVWAKAFDGSGHEGLEAIVLGSDNSLYVCGSSLSYGVNNQGIVQKWTTDGNLVWSTQWGGGNFENFEGIVMSSGEVFVIGQTNSYGKGDKDVAILRIATNGNLVWDKTFGGEFFDRGMAIVRRPSLLGNTSLRITGATEDSDALDVDVLYMSINEDGNLNFAKGFGTNSADQEGVAISAPGIFGGVTLIVGYTDVAGDKDSLFLNVNESWQIRLHKDQLGQANAIYRIGDEFLVGGQIANNGTSVKDAYLFRLSDSGVGVWFQTRDDSNETDKIFALSYFAGGVVVCGTSSGAAGEWQNDSYGWLTAAGSWYTPAWGISEVNATYANAAGTVTDITDGVMDSGGGGDDMFFELRQL